LDIPPKKLIVRLLEAAAMFALAMFLIKLGVCYLLSVKWVLLVLALLAVGSYIGYRIWKNKSQQRW